jgi:hypothetical protein
MWLTALLSHLELCNADVQAEVCFLSLSSGSGKKLCIEGKAMLVEMIYRATLKCAIFQNLQQARRVIN